MSPIFSSSGIKLTLLLRICIFEKSLERSDNPKFYIFDLSYMQALNQIAYTSVVKVWDCSFMSGSPLSIEVRGGSSKGFWISH